MSNQTEHRAACHDGAWDPTCAECVNTEVRTQTRILDQIRSALTAQHNEQEEQTQSLRALVKALDALPEGSVIRDGDGDLFTKQPNGEWRYWNRASEMHHDWQTGFLADYAPIGIESIPGEDVLPRVDDNPEPESVTVTLPRDVVERAIRNLATANLVARQHERGVVAERLTRARNALADALDAASATQEAAEGERVAQGHKMLAYGQGSHDGWFCKGGCNWQTSETHRTLAEREYRAAHDRSQS